MICDVNQDAMLFLSFYCCSNWSCGPICESWHHLLSILSLKRLVKIMLLNLKLNLELAFFCTPKMSTAWWLSVMLLCVTLLVTISFFPGNSFLSAGGYAELFSLVFKHRNKKLKIFRFRKYSTNLWALFHITNR